MKATFVLFTVIVSIVRSALADDEKTYVVKRGDNFAELAERFGVTPGEIRAANPHAYGVRCLKPYTIQMQDGTIRAHCGQPRYYLIAGATIVIPKSRLSIESENVGLNAKIITLQVGLTEAREHIASQAQKIGDLVKERDRLASSNAELARVNAAMVEANKNLANQYNEARAAADANLFDRRMSKIESREKVIIVVALASVAVLIFSFVYVWQSRRPLRTLERDRAQLEIMRKSVVNEAEELVGRRRALEEEEQQRRSAIVEEAKKQQELRAELTRWKRELEEQNNQVSARKREQDERQTALDEREQTLAGREAACANREKAIGRRVEELSCQEGALLRREKELTEKEHGVEELRKALCSQKARQDRTDIEQDERENALVKGFEDLNVRGHQLRAELDARQRELDVRQAEIDGKIRMFDEDIQPQIDALRQREQELRRQETDLALRLKEYQEAVEEIERQRANLRAAEQELVEAQESLGIEQRELEQRRTELEAQRDAFEQEMVAAREALAAEVVAAQSLIDTAGGLEKARRILSRAKRKQEITKVLTAREKALNAREETLNGREADLQRREEELKARVEKLAEREAAVTQRESDCDRREGALETWDDRLAAREGLRRSGLPRRPTLPPFPSLPTPAGDTDDDNPTVTFQPLPGDAVDPRATTHVEINTGLVLVVEPADIQNKENLNASLPKEPSSADTSAQVEHAAHTTGPQIPITDQPTPHSESSFWCSLCERDIPMDEMETHHELHRRQEKPGPLSQA